MTKSPGEPFPFAVSDLKVGLGDFTLGPVSFSLPRGSITALVGTNGSGKSTLMKSLLGLGPRDSGRTSRYGVEVDDDAVPSLLRVCGYMPDSPDDVVGEMSAIEYWQYCVRVRSAGVRERRDRYWESAKRMARLLCVDPIGIPIQRLSFGNRRKVQAVAALFHQPEIAVLDEPFTGLDFLSAMQLERLVRESANASHQGMPSNGAVLFSAHDFDVVARLADRVLLLVDGKLVHSREVGEMTGIGLRNQMLEAMGQHRPGEAGGE